MFVGFLKSFLGFFSPVWNTIRRAARQFLHLFSDSQGLMNDRTKQKKSQRRLIFFSVGESQYFFFTAKRLQRLLLTSETI